MFNEACYYFDIPQNYTNIKLYLIQTVAYGAIKVGNI